MSPPTPSADLARILASATFLKVLARDLLDADAAEDAAQEAAVRVLSSGRGDPDARAPRHPFTWLRSIAKHAAVSTWRKDARRRQRESASARAPDAPCTRALPGPDEILEREELRRRLVAHVLALPEAYRTVVLLRYFDELDVAEVARRLDAPIATVRTRLHRAHAQLRDKLETDARNGRAGPRMHWTQALLPLAGLRAPEAGATAKGIAMTKGSMLAAASGTLLLAGGWIAWQMVAPKRGSEHAPGALGVLASAGDAAADGRDAGRGDANGALVVAAPSPIAGPGMDPRRDVAAAEATITGRVRGPGGVPLPDVRVNCGSEVRTDGEGRFVLPAEPGGRYEIAFVRDGFLRVHRSEVFAGDALDVVLAPGVPVRGRVVDAETAVPVAGASVSVRHAGIDYLEVAQTDAGGAFHLQAPDGVSTELSVRSPSHEPWQRTPFDPRAHPDALDVRLPPLPRETVRVCVLAAESDAPLDEARFDGAARSLGDGRFEVDAARHGESVAFEAWAEGRVRVRVVARVTELDPASGTTIRLARPVPVRGRVVDESGAPLADATLIARGSGTQRVLGNAIVGDTGAPRMAVTGVDGAWRLDLVPGAVHRLSIAHAGHAPAEREVRVPEDASGEIVEPDVRLERAHALTGTVTSAADGAPIARGTVRLRDLPLTLSVRTDARGSFTLGHVPPGSVVRVEAAGFVPVVREITAIDGSKNLDVALLPGLAIRGVVQHADGRPAAGVALSGVWRRSDTGEDLPEEIRSAVVFATTDGLGQFELAGLVDGIYAIETGTRRPSSAAIEAEAGSEGVIVPWPDPTGIAGRVVSAATGLPIGEFDVLLTWTGDGDSGSRAGDRQNATGEFFYSVRPSTDVTVTVVAPGFARASIDGLRVAPGTIRHVVCKLDAPVAVEGIVRDERGDPVADLRLKLTRAHRDDFFGAYASTDEDGRFRCGELAPGDWEINAVLGRYGRGVERPVAITPALLHVERTPAEPVALTMLDPAGATVVVRVRLPASADPQSAVVTLRRRPDSGAPDRTSARDDFHCSVTGQGTATIPGVIAGTYDVTLRFDEPIGRDDWSTVQQTIASRVAVPASGKIEFDHDAR